ncbi:Cytochrome P450 704B1 [Phytophthora ramorum]|uniref:Cytochrome P450 704B1 n=1 Tax=Phytophthora ramorum TaxID=164328 RepID=UPI003098FDFC|nr:Cytochrome P450 704B1 [Phytophthora ramorum]
MWSSTSHDGAQQSVLMALGALTVVYASWKILNLPVPMPDPGMEQLFRPASTLPVLGNTLDVLLFNRYRMSDWINDQTDASSGQPWILQLLFQPPWVVLSMPNDLHDVFVDQFQVFEKGGTLGDISFDVLGNGLLNVNGDKWKQQRRAASHLFSTQSIRDVMEPVIREKTLQLRDVLAQSAGRKQTVSMKSLLGKFTSDVFTRIGFGVELDQLGGDVFKDEHHPLDIALHAVQNRFQTPAWMWKLARFLNVGAEKRLRESMKTVNDMVRDIMLRDDLQFAIMKAEQLTVLDPKAPAGLKKNPMDIKALVDVFAVFGFSPDDIIDKHDQCTIFRKIRAELDELLGDLAVNTKKYDKAILLRDRLRLIKLEFVEMQGTYETRRQYQEKQQFSRGIVLAKQRSDVLCESRTDACEREILLKQEELRKTQEVERVQLETYLTKLQEPHVKFSKLLLELKNTEKNLARLKLFEDAKNVFVRADSMERDQRALRTAKFERFKENKRALLLEKQQQELAEVKEKLMEKRYVVMRANDNHRKTEVQRMENLTSDMKHAHTKDMYGKKVFSTNAEATVRKSHGVTSSTYRGQQLLSTVQGKRLEVASLCLLHDSENGVVPPGSIIYTG